MQLLLVPINNEPSKGIERGRDEKQITIRQNNPIATTDIQTKKSCYSRTALEKFLAILTKLHFIIGRCETLESFPFTEGSLHHHLFWFVFSCGRGKTNTVMCFFFWLKGINTHLAK